MRRSALVSLLLGLLCAGALAPGASAAPSDYGFESVDASLSTHEAGAHPDFTTTIEFKQDPERPLGGNGLRPLYAKTHDIVIDTPPGLIGNPNAVVQCSAASFADVDTGCPLSSQVGIAVVDVTGLTLGLTEPVYLLEPPGEDTVARLALWAAVFPLYIDVEVRSESDYGVSATIRGISTAADTVRATTTIWGVPADESHDTLRLTSKEGGQGLKESPPRSAGLAPAPFLSNPTSCGEPLEVDFAADSYQLPGQFVHASASLGTIVGCGALDFAPTLTATPTTRQTASPSGLDVELSIPQTETVNSLATSQLRNATVEFPEGVTIASGAADGLVACSDAEAGYKTRLPSHCPAAAKVGSAEFESPALERPVHGALYQRSPVSGNLFRVWLLADELGVHVKIPGEIRLDPNTGQATSLFIDNPQVPVSAVRLHVKGGARGPFATPVACGTYLTRYELAPWSGKPATVANAPMVFDLGCGPAGFSPKLSAGTTNPLAGAFSAFVADFTRKSSEQNIAAIDTALPLGLLAKPAGVVLCEGAAAESGNCPPTSHIGSVAAAVGPGESPLWIPQPGKEPTAIYFSGSYKGAPYSIVAKVPAQAGPFDLGDVITRLGAHIDPNTAQVSVTSDPLPQMLEGVPVSYRHVHVDVDRPEFTLNPTSCKEKQTRATLTSVQGATATPTSRFQVGGCAALAYKPKLTMRLHGKTNRGAHPRLVSTFITRPGDANTARVQVALPHSEFLDQAHIRTICTRVQFAAEQCPKGSIYGRVKVTTSLLDKPLEGPVYLRSSSHPLPDIVAAVRGQIDFNLVGRIDSVKGGIRATFDSVPDAPVTKAVLSMQGGKKGLLVNSRNLCSAPSRSTVRLEGQNGKSLEFRPLLQNECGQSGKPRRHAG